MYQDIIKESLEKLFKIVLKEGSQRSRGDMKSKSRFEKEMIDIEDILNKL